MSGSSEPTDLQGVFSEYVATFEGGWKPTTKTKYLVDIQRFMDWLVTNAKPTTTDSLDFKTLLGYVGYLKTRPAVGGVWRGDAKAVERSRRTGTQTLSLNSVNAYMRSLKSVVLWAHDEGLIAKNPFGRSFARGRGHPLLPSEETPKKGASLDDIRTLERGCRGNAPIDLRDQAIVSLLKTTGARNSSVRLLRVADVDLERDLITFRRAKADKTFEVALQPETKAAVLRYLHRGRRHLLPHYPVRGFESIALGQDSDWLFPASGSGLGSAQPLTANGLSEMLTRRYRAGGGTLGHFGSHRIRHGVGRLLANNGMGLDELSRYYAHGSTEVTKIYAPQTPQTLGHQAAEALWRSGLVAGQRARRRRA